ncbi:hypothetical protein ABK040_009131 [Willaertia magna]
MSTAKEFSQIYLGRTSGSLGNLTVDAKNDSGDIFSWRSNSSSGTSSVNKRDIKSIDWLYTSKGYELRVWTEDECIEYVGFKESDYDTIEAQITQFQLENDIPFGKVDLCLQGVNWGKPQMKSNQLIMLFNGKESFSISVPDEVKNCQKLPKNSELVLELRGEEENLMGPNEIQLSEIRFICPEGEGEENNVLSVENLHKAITDKADLSRELGNAIAIFSQVPAVTPRGKYNVDLFKNHLRLHGRTYAHNINYKQISTLFLLPKPGGTHMYLVISLDAPIRQGQKPYFHVVFQFEKRTQIKPEDPLNLKLDKKELETQYAEYKLTNKMSGKLYEVFAKIIRAFTHKKLIGPGKFSTTTDDKAVKCSLKANEGFLYFLEKSVFFLHKPVIYMRHEEIKSFKPQRAHDIQRSGGSRSFDLVIALKNGKSHTFSNISKEEYDALIKFLQEKGLPVENVVQPREANLQELAGDDDEEDDEDFVAGKDDEEEDDEDFNEFVTEKELSAGEAESLKDSKEGDSQEQTTNKRKKDKENKDENKKKKKKE